MKKIFSLLLTLSMFLVSIPPALAASVSFDVTFDRSAMLLNVSGTCSSERKLTFYVSDESIPASEIRIDNLYAMEQTQTNEDGSFNMDIKLPEDLAYGNYKVVVGGLGTDVAEADRSAVFSYQGLENFSLWLEAETDAKLSGNYKITTGNTASSGGGLIIADTDDTSVENKAVFTFDIPVEGNFDIWVLSTLGNADYVSRYLYSIDGAEAESNANAALESVYTTSDIRQVPVYWTKLTNTDFTGGEHTLTFCANEMRTFGGFIYHALDSVVIVPSEWSWQPNKLHKAYNVNSVKLECTQTDYYAGNAERSGSVNVYITTKLLEETIHDTNVWAAVVKNGELVASAVKDTSVLTSKATVGREYKTELNISIPSFAPDGDYEILCGMGEAMQKGFYSVSSDCEKTADGYVKAGSFKIGNSAAPSPKTVEFETVTLESGKETITAHYKLSSSTAASDERAFIKLWKDDVLWGVAESETPAAVSDTSSEHTIELKLPEGIPQDTYNAELGFYNVNGTMTCGSVDTLVNGKYGYKPLSNGVYTAKKTGNKHFWYVSQENTLIWDGEPYIPIGGMECLSIANGYSKDTISNESLWAADKAELETLIANGVTDLYINSVAGAQTAPGWVWEYIFSFLEENGVRYSLQTNAAAANKMEAFYIRSNSGAIEVSDITSDGVVEASADIPVYGSIQSTSGYYVLINSNDEAVKTGSCSVTKENEKYKFSADITLPSPGTYKVAFTPKTVQNSVFICNFWDNAEENLEYAEKFGRLVSMGDNFRCIIDPLINESGYYNYTESIRPYSAAYNNMYANWLRAEYASVEELISAWGTSGVSDFETASRLIPVYTAENNQSDYNIYAVDPETNKLYTLKGRSGIMWSDYLAFRDESTADFYNQVSDKYKETVDVPVVIKNVWGHKEYFINKNQKGGFDGLGTEAYGSVERLKYLQTSCYGMGQQFGKTAWLIVTETETEEDIAKKYNAGDFGYGTEQNMHDHFDALFEYGAKGIFDFLYSARHHEMTHKAYSYIANPEMFGWANNYKSAFDENSAAKYVPDEHKVYMMPHNSNFYTIPNRYSAVLYNDDYSAIIQPMVYKNMMLMPVEDANIEGEIIAATFQNGPASQRQGKEFGSMLEQLPAEKQAVYIGLRKDLGTVPQLDKYFTDRYSTNSDGEKVQILAPSETSQIIKTTSDGSPWMLRDGNLWIIAADNAIGSDSVKYLDEIGIFMDGADLVWRDESIKKSDGSTALSAGEYTASVQVKNNTYNAVNAVIFAATYSGGRLTGVTKYDQKLYSGLNGLKTSVTASDTDNELKIFIWDMENGMKPIGNMESLKK